MHTARDSRPVMEINSSCDTQLHRRIEYAMSEFGRDVLTARERAVVRLILLGLPSKVAAVKLQIAPKTEGVHRRNAYAKLGVRSQAALFRQFLDFLSASWTQDSRTPLDEPGSAPKLTASVLNYRQHHESTHWR